jgi:hypothetical protein
MGPGEIYIADFPEAGPHPGPLRMSSDRTFVSRR